MTQQVPKALPKRLEQQEKALAARAAGMTYVQIGQVLGVSFSRARKIVVAAIADRRKRVDEKVDEVLQIELERLDAITMSLWKERGDPKVADALVRIGERRSRLLGLDQAQRHEITGKDGGPISIEDTRARNLELIDQLAGKVAAGTAGIPGGTPGEAIAGAEGGGDPPTDAGAGSPVSPRLEELVGPSEPASPAGGLDDLAHSGGSGIREDEDGSGVGPGAG
jgi:hypothetical protein